MVWYGMSMVEGLQMLVAISDTGSPLIIHLAAASTICMWKPHSSALCNIFRHILHFHKIFCRWNHPPWHRDGVESVLIADHFTLILNKHFWENIPIRWRQAIIIRYKSPFQMCPSLLKPTKSEFKSRHFWWEPCNHYKWVKCGRSAPAQPVEPMAECMTKL